MQIVIVLIGISFVTFLLTYLSPGDPVRNMFSATGVMPTEGAGTADQRRDGAERTVFHPVFPLAVNCLHGNFGKSYPV